MTPPHIRHCRVTELPEDSELYDAACSYALKPREVRCPCGTVGGGSQMDLERVGWRLTKLGEVCPQCTVVREPLEYAYGYAQ